MPMIRCLSGPILVAGRFLYPRETRDVTDHQLADVKKKYGAELFEVIGAPADASTESIEPESTEESEAGDEHPIFDADDAAPKRSGRAKRRA